MEMEVQFMSSLYPKGHWRSRKTSLFQAWNHQQGITAISFKANINNGGCATPLLHHKKTLLVESNQNFFRMRAIKNTEHSKDVSIIGSEKKGTVIGAVALIVGTSIGSGILAIPMKTSPAGFIPSAVAMILCWGFLLIEALLLAEINVSLMRKKKRKRKEDELEVISLRTMAQETLGEWGGTLTTINYIFLAYTTMVAYTSKSGEILYHLISIPPSISGFFFTTLFTILISVGGTRTTDQVNQWLTFTMIGLLVAIEVLTVMSGGWSGLESLGNWGKVPTTIPVIIFALVYHDLAPVICAYLDGDLARIKVSIILGSLVPLSVLLVWDAVTLGLLTHADQIVDPIDLLMRVRWSGVSAMVEAFSLLAVGTSLIGTLLGFSQFFLEQLNNLSWDSSSTKIKKSEEIHESSVLRDESTLFGLRKWWGTNKLSVTATAMAVTPPLFISTTVPDVFSTATDIAGGYCMATLYGVLPPIMAWAMHTRLSNDTRNDKVDDNIEDIEDNGGMELSRVTPALFGAGLFAFGIVMEQLLQDLLGFLR